MVTGWSSTTTICILQMYNLTLTRSNSESFTRGRKKFQQWKVKVPLCLRISPGHIYDWSPFSTRVLTRQRKRGRRYCSGTTRTGSRNGSYRYRSTHKTGSSLGRTDCCQGRCSVRPRSGSHSTDVTVLGGAPRTNPSTRRFCGKRHQDPRIPVSGPRFSWYLCYWLRNIVRFLPDTSSTV